MSTLAVKHRAQTPNEIREIGRTFTNRLVAIATATLTRPDGTTALAPALIQTLPDATASFSVGPLPNVGVWVLRIIFQLDDQQTVETIWHISVATVPF